MKSRYDLPRQARDKHKESSTKRVFCSYVGDPPNANGEAYYSLTGLAPTGQITAEGRTYDIKPEHGMGWIDHQ